MDDQLFEQVKRAEELGQISALLVAAGLASVEAVPPAAKGQNPGGGMGPLALSIYRAYGRDGLLHLGQYFEAGYKSMGARVNAGTMGWSAMVAGIVAVLPPEATEVERAVISEAMLATEDQWASRAVAR